MANKYTLGDYVIKNWNDWDRVPRDPFTIGNAILYTIGASTTSLAVIYGIGVLAISAVTSFALNALAPKLPAQRKGTLINSKEALGAAEFVYGEVRKGGNITFAKAEGTNNQYLHQILVLAAHEVESIGDIYLNDEVASFDTDGITVTTTATGEDNEVDWKSKVQIRKFDGSQTTADSSLATLTGVSNFIGKNIAFLHIRYEYDKNVFADGIPLVTAKVKGKKVYDPRTSTTAWSDNAALCIRDFLTSPYGLNDNAIDDTSFSAAANDCDDDITLSGGGTQKRYRINGVVKSDESIGNVLGEMTGACVGTLFWGVGAWKLKVGVYNSPVKSFDLSDLRGPIQLDTRTSIRDSFNTVRGTFVNESADYITEDYETVTSATFKTQDGGEELALDLPLPYTTNFAEAKRIAKQTLFRSREQMTFIADFGLEALGVEVGDIVTFTNSRYGWTNKEFEVVGWNFNANQDAGDLRVSLTLRETSSAAFDWNAEESAIIANDTTLTDARTGLTVSNLTVTDKGNTQKDGTFVGQALVQWTQATNKFLNHYEVQWKDVNESSYQRTEIPAGDSSVIIGPLETGTQYNIRVRGVTVSNVEGSWVSATPYTHGGDTTAPSAVSGLSATGGPKNVTLDWTAPTTNTDASTLYDLKGYNIYRNTSNSQPANPIAFSGSDKYVDGGLGVNTDYYYWVTAVDFTGNESSSVASGLVTTDSVASGVDTDTRIYSGRLYWQTLQASAPSGADVPSASNFTFNVSSQVFTTLQTGWSHSQTVVANSSLSVKEWSVPYTVVVDADDNVDSISFGTIAGAFQITDTIESDNYSAGSAGWKIGYDGTAEFDAAVIRGTLQVGNIPTLTSTQISDLGALATKSSVSASTEVTGLATVATSGSYNSLSDQPTLFSGSYTDLTNQPSLFDGAYSSLSGTPTLGTLASQNTVNYSTQVTSKPFIPSATSDLTNDSDYQTGSQVSSSISTATSGLATESYVTTQIGTKNKIHYTTSTPTATATGDLWYNTSTNVFKRWSGSSWVDVSIVADSIAANYIYAGTINGNQINVGTITVDRLAGLSELSSSAVNYTYVSTTYKTGSVATLTLSGILTGSKFIAGFSGEANATSASDSNPYIVSPYITCNGTTVNLGRAFNSAVPTGISGNIAGTSSSTSLTITLGVTQSRRFILTGNLFILAVEA